MGRRRKDEIGNRYGRLVVLEYAGKSIYNGGTIWRCICDCGKTVEVPGGKLRNGDTKSCGCLRHDTLDLVGKQFDKLTVIKKCERTDGKYVKWSCKCSCGNTTKVTTGHLQSGHTRSCGCLQREVTAKTNSIDETGNKHGRLVVLERSEKRTSSNVIMWKCSCSCGNMVEVSSTYLRSNCIQSCGCLWLENIIKANTVHGKCSNGSRVSYPKEWTRNLRAFVRKRDGHKCKICAKTLEEEGKSLSVHHIDYDVNNCKPSNLISLCTSCHVKTNTNREAWMEFFKVLLEEKHA